MLNEIMNLLNECKNNLFKYYLVQDFDDNDNIYKECYNSCKKCIQAGNEEEHNCDVCINNYIFLNDALVPSKNCYLQWQLWLL